MRLARNPYLLLVFLLLAGCEGASHTEPDPRQPIALSSVGGAQYASRVGSDAPPYEVQALSTFGVPLIGLEIEWLVGPEGGSVTPALSTTAIRTTASGELRPFASSVHTLGPSEGLYTVTARIVGHPEVPPLTLSTFAVTEVILVATPDYWSCYYEGICEAAFEPAEVVIAAGQTVGWNWNQGQCNVVFEDDPSQPVSSGVKNSGRHVRTFTERGSYRFRCTHHSENFEEGMVGVVNVQ